MSAESSGLPARSQEGWTVVGRVERWLLTACLLRIAMHGKVKRCCIQSYTEFENPIPASKARYFVGRSVSTALRFKLCSALWAVFLK